MRIRLRTIGARSGEPREVPLYAWADGDDLILVGSRGGSARDPGWAYNLRASPTADITVGAESWSATAHELFDAADYDAAWAIAVAGFPTYTYYRQRTKRRIPLFRLVRDA